MRQYHIVIGDEPICMFRIRRLDVPDLQCAYEGPDSKKEAEAAARKITNYGPARVVAGPCPQDNSPHATPEAEREWLCETNADLLEACEDILPDLETDYIANPYVAAGRRREEHKAKIRAAIAKAKGE